MTHVRIHGFGCTDIGIKRSRNEDAYTLDEKIFVISDGMGGHNAGDIASSLTVDYIIKTLNETLESDDALINNTTMNQQRIKDAIQKTNRFIFDKANQHEELKGMGATIVLALFQPPNMFHIGNVGDSRAYLLSNSLLEQLSEDHSVTANLLKDGIITESEAKHHPYRHHLSRTIGTSISSQAFTTSISVRPGDKILLCSDGLWNALSDSDITTILKNDTSPKRICKDFIARAITQKATDNITCIIIEVINK